MLGGIHFRGVKIFLASQPCDMRAGFERLAALALALRLSRGERGLWGAMFLFTNRSRSRLKILYHDGSGLWVMAKRLERGSFGWPKFGEVGCVCLDVAELTLLLEGIDVGRMKKRRWSRFDELEK
jgi:transposase